MLMLRNPTCDDTDVEYNVTPCGGFVEGEEVGEMSSCEGLNTKKTKICKKKAKKAAKAAKKAGGKKNKEGKKNKNKNKKNKNKNKNADESA